MRYGYLIAVVLGVIAVAAAFGWWRVVCVFMQENVEAGLPIPVMYVTYRVTVR